MSRSEIWFSDGSIVLQAQDTQFKVHRTVLARHSTIFSDILDLPQPEGEPMVEGCPVVVLQDSAEDVRHMLLALYDKCYNQHGSIPFEAVSAMIRMGRKYDIKVLRDEGLARMKNEIPSTREDIENLPRALACKHISPEPRLLYKLINLALDNDIQTVLPAAFAMSLFNTEYLKMDPEGTDEFLRDSTKCLITRGDIELTHWHDQAFGWIDDLGMDCNCANFVAIEAWVVGRLWRPRPRLYRMFDKSDTIEFFLRVDYQDPENLLPSFEERGVCTECYQGLKNHFLEKQRECWDNLPSAFGLPGWTDLKDFGGL